MKKFTELLHEWLGGDYKKQDTPRCNDAELFALINFAIWLDKKVLEDKINI